MIVAYAAIAALTVTTLGLAAALVLLERMHSAERRNLVAAAFQAQGKTDAARRAQAPTHAEAKAAVDQQLAVMKEAREGGGVFSSANPFGTIKPTGI